MSAKKEAEWKACFRGREKETHTLKYIHGLHDSQVGGAKMQHRNVTLLTEFCRYVSAWFFYVSLFTVSCELFPSVKSPDRGSKAVVWHLGVWRLGCRKSTVDFFNLHTYSPTNSRGLRNINANFKDLKPKVQEEVENSERHTDGIAQELAWGYNRNTAIILAW